MNCQFSQSHESSLLASSSRIEKLVPMSIYCQLELRHRRILHHIIHGIIPYNYIICHASHLDLNLNRDTLH